MEARRDVFQAIADPTRRAIIGMVARKPAHVNAIAEQFDVSRQAVSLHLKILSECGLLNVQQNGRERIYEAKLEKLGEVYDWVDQYRNLWAHRLNALKDLVEQEALQPENTTATRTKKRGNAAKSKSKK
jgi:DNA-binding transcriptional ArsR family regulator